MIVPSAAQAYEDLVEDVQDASAKLGDHTRKAMGSLRQELGQFIMTGLELEGELCVHCGLCSVSAPLMSPLPLPSFDLRLRAEKRKAAKGGELFDEKTFTNVTWPAWWKRADAWRIDQAKYMPLLGVNAAETPAAKSKDGNNGDNNDDSDDDDDEDEGDAGLGAKPTSSATPVARHDEVLGLPSDFSTEEIMKYDLQLLAAYEARIRVGQAFDQLEVVRRAVMHLAAFVDAKKENAHGRKESMRANITNRYSELVRNDAARKYNAIYDRLVKLRPKAPSSEVSADPRDPASYLQRIDIGRGDLMITNMKAAREQGDHHHSGSWIWWAFEDVMSVVEANQDAQSTTSKTTAKSTSKSARPNTRGASKGKAPAPVEPEAVQGTEDPVVTKKYTTWCMSNMSHHLMIHLRNRLSVDRAQWFRAWQEKLRCDEAVNILCADFRATIRGFSALGDRWLEASKASGLELSERTYAIERRHIFKFKSHQCQEAYDDARHPGVPADQLDHALVCYFELHCIVM